MPVFCRKKCFVGWSQCKNPLMYSSGRNELHFAWSSLYQMMWNELEWASMKPWGCTHEKRRQDRLHSVRISWFYRCCIWWSWFGRTFVSQILFSGTSGSHKLLQKFQGSRFADSLIHRLSSHCQLTGAVAQRRERNAALCAIQKPGQDFCNLEFTESNFGHVLLFGIIW